MKNEKIRLFVATYFGLTLTISSTTYGLFEIKTVDAIDGVKRSFNTTEEVYRTISECLDEEDDGECSVSWERDYFKTMYYSYVWDIHAYDYEYAEI